ncbi:MDR family MFS transporter [Streptomyces acidiscabies]|uniref:MDR family MFS transporter n=1 Tax=Streptomyces acidiscabies TaxID=42234 RepID=A0AAP6EI76_9ACTN|nr:MDR family MFS transporter [Streptomyces acidiscabies]MBZ3915115.1 multidrug efflux MFS transporter [Streptomyces acidiscabies]MDX2963618.1 MDR family MFS transporter [Streptomyces acidiscabies]MDX3021177.1 MDR family MFS transporter [Streptomyces acidiscabies]MDX3794766.1 MDR family MFS transporter [Streptomyces acidiscabies]GAV45903.1 putative transport protein HsrA [Streptomyces acidiscabies]
MPEVATQPRTKDRLDPALLKLAVVLVLGALAPLLDSTIVAVAIDTLGRDLDVSTATVQWVSTAYLLAFAVVVPVSGWAIERIGARKVWLGALVLFLAGSMLCGLAWDIWSLVAFRVVQGIGGGMLMPVLQTVILRASGGKNVGRLMAVVSLPALIGPILGPVVGALIIDHFSWRWIFYVNLPVCLLALALAWRTVPRQEASPAHTLDVTGLLLISPALAALIYGFSQQRTALPVGVVLLAVFVWHALRRAQPLVDLRLLRNRSLAVSATLMFLNGLTLYGGMFLLPLYYQQQRGAGVLEAGLLLAPQGVGSLLARVAGPLADRLGPRPVMFTGLLLTAVTTIPFTLDNPSTPLLATALVVRGFGMSAVNIAIMVGAYADVPGERVPHASTIVRIVQQLGGSFGTAVLAGFLTQGFPYAFAWATGFTVFACAISMLYPAATKND